MGIKRVKTGWQVDCWPKGRYGPRVRRTFKQQASAKRFEAKIMGLGASGEDIPELRRDKRRLRDLVEQWYEHHGHTLKSAPDRVRSLRKLTDALGNPLATKFTAQQWVEYRSERLKEVKPNTINHEHTYLKAVFSELERLSLWPHGNPMQKIRKVRTDETEKGYLDQEQITLLLDHLRLHETEDCYFITVICLSTGARWSEAQSLRAENVRNDRIVFVGTKSGKTRTVPIAPSLAKQLRQRRKIGRLFGNRYKAFARAIKTLRIELPEGQLTHVLRHTFASHFMMNGGNILVLQQILGHQSITMTMRYAHFAPDHLEEAAKLNPLAMSTL
ncbi:phage integrase [Vreelandella zhanjiangensis]|uniref:phage integrase n=1 Tax=Vreelandella zhanjiangensis TaxID=1121960 RepID=UPI0003818572|nr:tyrosine-type recombinase/integrase [Halomonas zhanjiangensis]